MKVPGPLILVLDGVETLNLTRNRVLGAFVGEDASEAGLEGCVV
jgi:hypothetical protein